MLAKRHTFKGRNSQGFSVFRAWVDGEARKREAHREALAEVAAAAPERVTPGNVQGEEDDIEENNGESVVNARFCASACDVFDYAVAVEAARKDGQRDNCPSPSFSEQCVLFGSVNDQVRHGYKWALYLVRCHPPDFVLDIRAMQMWTLLGTAMEDSVEVLGRTVPMPTPGLRAILQVPLFTDMDKEKQNSSRDLVHTLYLYALGHQKRVGYKAKMKQPRDKALAVDERRRKRRRKKSEATPEDEEAIEEQGVDQAQQPDDNSERPKRKKENTSPVHVRIARVLDIIFRAWTLLALDLQFNSLSEMVYPHCTYMEETGDMLLVPDASRVLTPEYELKLKIVTEEQRSSGIIGVERSAEMVSKPLRSMNQQATSLVRRFVSDLFATIGKLVTDDEVFLLSENKDFIPQKLLSLVQENQNLPIFFQYSEEEKDLVRVAVSSGRGQGIGERLQASNQAARQRHDLQNEHPVPAQTEPVQEQHICDGTCDCEDLEYRIEDRLSLSHITIVNCRFMEMPGVVETLECEFKKRSVQLILTEPPRNVLWGQQSDSNNPEAIGAGDCAQFVKFVAEYLRAGGHLILIISSMHFEAWKKLFREFREKESDERAFLVDTHPLLMLPETKDVTTSATQTLTHENIALFALHLSRRGDVFGEGHTKQEMVQWEPHGHVLTTFSARTNVIDNVPDVKNKEIIRKPAKQKKTSRRQAEERPLRRDQKSVALMSELVCRYSLPGDIVVDPFGGTFSTAEACLNVEKPRRFFGADVKRQFVDAGKKRCLHAFVRRVVTDSESSEFFRIPDEIRELAATLYDRSYRLLERNASASGQDSSVVPLPHSEVPCTQILPYSMRANLSSLTGSLEFMWPMCELKGPDKWTRRMYAMLAAESISTLRAAECARHSIALTREKFLVVVGKASKGEKLGSYFGTLVYSDLTREPGRGVVYGEHCHKVTKQLFESKHVSVLNEGNSLKFKDVSLKSIFVVPAEYCPYYHATFSSKKEEQNAELCVRPALCMREVQNPTLIEVRATKSLKSYEPIVLSPKPVYLDS